MKGDGFIGVVAEAQCANRKVGWKAMKLNVLGVAEIELFTEIPP